MNKNKSQWQIEKDKKDAEGIIPAFISIVVIILIITFVIVPICKNIADGYIENSVHFDESPAGPWGNNPHKWDTPRPR